MLVRKRSVSESAFKQRHSEEEMDAIGNLWCGDMLKILNNPNQSGYLNMRDAYEYFVGVYDLGHERGTHEQVGGNLIAIIPDTHEPE